MGYELEHHTEFDRLEKQATIATYDYRSELSGLPIENGAVILDAGCGSGVVSRYLASLYKTSVVVACDLSAPRLQQARNAAASIPNLRFDEQDLRSLTYADAEFDIVLLRYVIEHHIPEDVECLLGELVRVLKPGGTLLIVDVDGHMHNIYPQTPIVRLGLERFLAAKKIDLYVGRKLPHLLAGHGLTGIAWRIETITFQGALKDAEKDLMRDRFEVAGAFFEEVLGGPEASLRFQNEYLGCMEYPHAVSFSNKFIVTAKKALLPVA